jgi:hypothetical protein
MRITESVALNGITTATAADGEIAIITNTETTTIRVAHGTTPDGAAAIATPATSAFYAIGEGQTFAVRVVAGDRFSAKALS